MINQSNPVLIHIYYILGRVSFLSLAVDSQRIHDNSILINADKQFMLALHLRLTSFFYFNQLIDIFAYNAVDSVAVQPFTENPLAQNTTVVLQIFHFLNLHRKLYIFVVERTLKKKMRLRSVEDFFKNAWWAERETAELFGINYTNKSDARNLLLQYGMLDYPMQKFFPVIGTSEVVYYQLIDSVIKTPLALQF